MAKNQRVRLDKQSIALNEMEKTLVAMNKTLNSISNITTDIVKKINEEAVRSLQRTKRSVDDILNSTRKLRTDFVNLPTQNENDRKLMDHIFGRSKIYNLFRNISDTDIGRRKNISNAEANYQKQIVSLSKAKSRGEITDEQYSEGVSKASEEKASILNANSIQALSSMAIGSIEGMAIDMIIKIGKKAFEVIDDTASYAVSTSYIVNSQAREQMLAWGLSETQNYAFTKTKELMNMRDEDLYWMNDNQKAMFSDLMQKETEIYQQMTSDGTLEAFQKMKIDVEILKQEFYAYVVKFISENKDTILYCLETGIQLLEAIMKTVSVLSNFTTFNWGRRIAEYLRGNNTITLNNYINEASDANDTANKITEGTIATLATYSNS